MQRCCTFSQNCDRSSRPLPAPVTATPPLCLNSLVVSTAGREGQQERAGEGGGDGECVCVWGGGGSGRKAKVPEG